jgi:Tfp pilus assembly protein PilN
VELKSSYQVKVNLLPKKYVIKKTPNWIRILFFTLTVGITLYFLFAYTINDNRIQILTTQIESMTAEIKYLQEQETKLQEIQKQIDVIQKRIDIVRALIASEPDWLKIVNSIGNSMPDDVFLNSADFTGTQITFTGTSHSIFSIAQFIDSLSQYQDLFVNAEFQSLSLKDSLYDFNLVLELRKHES